MKPSLLEIARSIAESDGKVRTAGTIEFKKDSGPVRRDIRVKDFSWSPDCLRDLARVLWSVQRSHSYAMSAYRLFSKIPSSKFSPDGLLGGKGYIQSIKEMRNGLAQAVEFLSACTDTMHDEINAEHWSSSGDIPNDVQDIVNKSEEIKANPEEFVEQEYDQDFGTSPGEDDFSESDSEDEEEMNENPSAEDMNPVVEGEEDEESEDLDSDSYPRISSKKKLDSVPTDESDQEEAITEVESFMHTTIPASKYSSSINKIIKSISKRASSSLPLSTLPGPRIEHIGPGEENPEWGSDDPAGDDLFSGTNTSVPSYEDGMQDGVTGYDGRLTDSPTYLAIASDIAGKDFHSWLPGSNNDKFPNIYQLGYSSTEEDIESADLSPDVYGVNEDKPKTKDLWGRE